MAKTKRLTVKQELERKHGKKLPQIIMEAYNRHQTLDGTADELGISKSGLQYYIVKFNLYVETTRTMTQVEL